MYDTIAAREKTRETINQQIDDFFAKGGKVDVVSTNEEEVKEQLAIKYRGELDRLKKRY